MVLSINGVRNPTGSVQQPQICRFASGSIQLASCKTLAPSRAEIKSAQRNGVRQSHRWPRDACSPALPRLSPLGCAAPPAARSAPRDDPRAPAEARDARHGPKMADFATTEEPRSEDEDEPMEDDNDFLADDAPAASHEPPPQVKQTQPSPVSVANVARSRTRRISATIWTLKSLLKVRELYRAIWSGRSFMLGQRTTAQETRRWRTSRWAPCRPGLLDLCSRRTRARPGQNPGRRSAGVTVVLVCCAYRGQEFLRIGYYVNNEAPEGEAPSKANVTRTLLAEQPRVTRVDIDRGEAGEACS